MRLHIKKIKGSHFMMGFPFLSILLNVFVSNAQFNQKYDLGQQCAIGNSVAVDDSSIHVAGTLCFLYNTNQIGIRAYLSSFDIQGNLQYFDYVGDTLQGYRGEKLLLDSAGNKYIIGTYTTDSLGNPLPNRGVFVQKRNAQNTVLWTTEYRDSISTISFFIWDATLLDNGHTAVVGDYNMGDSVIVPGVADTDILFLVFDSNGSLMTQNQIGSKTSKDKGWSIKSDGSGKVLIGGHQLYFPGFEYYSWVISADYQGNVLDEYVSQSQNIEGARDLIRTKDGGVAYVSNLNNGNSLDTRYKIFVEKLDSNLNSEWTYQSGVDFNQVTEVTGIDQDHAGNLFISGKNFGFLFDPDTGGYYGFLQKMSPQGDSLWQRNYGILNTHIWDQFHQFDDMEIKDGMIYMTGQTQDLQKPNPPQQEMWLVVVDSNGCLIPGCAVGLEEYHKEQEISLYPNPAGDRIFLDLSMIPFGNARVEVFDLQSNRVLSKAIINEFAEIDVSALPPSMYLLRVYAGKSVRSVKFVKE